MNNNLRRAFDKLDKDRIKLNLEEQRLCFNILKHVDFSDFDKVMNNHFYCSKSSPDRPLSADNYKNSLFIQFHDSDGYCFCDCESQNFSVKRIIETIGMKGFANFNDFYNVLF